MNMTQSYFNPYLRGRSLYWTWIEFQPRMLYLGLQSCSVAEQLVDELFVVSVKPAGNVLVA